MRSAIYVVLFYAVVAAIAAGGLLPGAGTWQQGGLFMLLGLAWYPIDRVIRLLFPTDARPPGGQDKT